jgi:hypothetical protein
MPGFSFLIRRASLCTGIVLAIALGFTQGYADNSPVVFEDSFVRPDQNGWNRASDSLVWMNDSQRYPGTVTAISNNKGFVDTFTATTDHDEWMGEIYIDQLVTADFNVLTIGQEAFQYGARLLGRVTDGHHFINFTVNYATSTLQLWVSNNENWAMMKGKNAQNRNDDIFAVLCIVLV